MTSRSALYAGSFDPITFGHIDIIERATCQFDHLFIGVAYNPDKKQLFSREERIQLIEEATRYLGTVSVISFQGEYTVRKAKELECQSLIRGVRTLQDFSAEAQMSDLNHDLEPDIETTVYFARQSLGNVSSSAVKGFVGPKGWQDAIRKFVPSNVIDALEIKHQEGKL